tara:strand:+ start:638 stop:1465 length:828 start_codon:yes stop_codon:yes gene_type:complete
MNPKYPVYIPSKGRWESRLTSKALEQMNVPYHIVVEPQEYQKYSNVIDPDKILVLPFSHQGLFTARNWIMKHSIQSGAERHWQLDDNMNGFIRLNRNERVLVTSGTIFRIAEDFVDRYENVAIAGFEYRFFSGGARRKKPPYRLNTRIYSCSLVNNKISQRWRSLYNDDTDICLQVLKDGWCTILFHTFLCNKARTMTIQGGNTEELYSGDGRKNMAEALQKLHPDVTTVVRRWDRWQHLVDYSPFKKNKLIKKKNIIIPGGVNNYGMVLKEVKV